MTLRTKMNWFEVILIILGASAVGLVAGLFLFAFVEAYFVHCAKKSIDEHFVERSKIALAALGKIEANLIAREQNIAEQVRVENERLATAWDALKLNGNSSRTVN